MQTGSSRLRHDRWPLEVDPSIRRSVKEKRPSILGGGFILPTLGPIPRFLTDVGNLSSLHYLQLPVVNGKVEGSRNLKSNGRRWHRWRGKELCLLTGKQCCCDHWHLRWDVCRDLARLAAIWSTGNRTATRNAHGGKNQFDAKNTGGLERLLEDL